MKNNSFLEEMNVYPQTNLGKKIWVADEDGYPCVPSSWRNVSVTSITLNKTSLSTETGKSETLTAIVLPDNATDKSVTWSSSNTSIATVDNNGKVTAKNAGSATITCTANDGSGVQATCAVTVTNPKPDKIVLPT